MSEFQRQQYGFYSQWNYYTRTNIPKIISSQQLIHAHTNEKWLFPLL